MRLNIKVRPNSKEERIEKTDDFDFSVRVKEPPIEGEANKAVVRILADYFGVAQSNIRIISGYASRNKIVEID